MPRLVGKQGAVYIGGTGTGQKIADIYNWTLEVNVEVAECGRKGETHQKYAVGATTSRVTAERYVTSPTALASLAVVAGTSGGNSTGGNTVTYQLVGLDDTPGSAPAAAPVITGEGYVSKGNLAVPRGLITDTLEITGNQMPVVTR